MPAPTTYSEIELAEYMHETLQGAGLTGLADMLEITAPVDPDLNSYAEPVNEALLMLDVETIADLEGRAEIRKLRVAARLEAWRLALNRATPLFNGSQGNVRREFEPVWQHCRSMFDLAYGDALAAGIDPTGAGAFDVSVSTIVYRDDWYELRDEDERLSVG